MKKKCIIILLVLVLFIITGCGNKVDESIVKVNDVELHIDKRNEFNGIKYMITDDLKEARFDQYVQYYLYQESGSNLLFFRIFFYKDKDIKYIKKDLAIDTNLAEINGKTDNVDYIFIDMKRNDGTIHFYIIKKDNVSYVVNFVSKYDINDFENRILNSISF